MTPTKRESLYPAKVVDAWHNFSQLVKALTGEI